MAVGGLDTEYSRCVTVSNVNGKNDVRVTDTQIVRFECFFEWLIFGTSALQGSCHSRLWCEMG
jgi:hypothetical protein